MARSATGATTTQTDTTAAAARVFKSDRALSNQAHARTDSGDGTPAAAFRVRVDTGSAVSGVFRIPQIHGSGQSKTIAAGSEYEFITVDNNRNAIGDELFAAAATAGTLTYSWETIA